MKEVFYKGVAYQAEYVPNMDSENPASKEMDDYWALYDKYGAWYKTVHVSELDTRTIVTFILDTYYKNLKTA